MKGSYKRIVEAMKDSDITQLSFIWADANRAIDALFRQTTIYWSTIIQYNELKKLSCHNFNSAIPDITCWNTAEVWGYLLLQPLLNYYSKIYERVSEDDFHLALWDKVLRGDAIVSDPGIPSEIKIAAKSLARYETAVFKETGHYMTKIQLKKRYEVHKNLHKAISLNLEIRQKNSEESVDAILSGYSTERIVSCLMSNSEESAMALQLFVGLNLTPALSGDRIEDDRRRNNRLFEPECTCSLKKAQTGIDDILSGYAYTNFSTHKDRIQFWKDWLYKWETADNHIRLEADELRKTLINLQCTLQHPIKNTLESYTADPMCVC